MAVPIICPGDIECFKITFIKTCLCDWLYLFCLLFCIADPGHAIASGFHDDGAYLLQQLFFILCMNQRIIAMVTQCQGTTLSLESLFCLLALGNIMNDR